MTYDFTLEQIYDGIRAVLIAKPSLAFIAKCFRWRPKDRHIVLTTVVNIYFEYYERLNSSTEYDGRDFDEKMIKSLLEQIEFAIRPDKFVDLTEPERKNLRELLNRLYGKLTK